MFWNRWGLEKVSRVRGGARDILPRNRFQLRHYCACREREVWRYRLLGVLVEAIVFELQRRVCRGVGEKRREMRGGERERERERFIAITILNFFHFSLNIFPRHTERVPSIPYYALLPSITGACIFRQNRSIKQDQE